MMIEIDDKIVSLDILKEHFLCDISKCKGICCVEGNAGAPLNIDEVDLLEQEWANYKPYMTKEGVSAVERDGFMVIDSDGDYTTTLVNDSECAYSYQDGDITLCAIEKAWLEGKTEFRKPISCHLYPIRVLNFKSGGVGLNYHRWSVCRSACENGCKKGVPVYKSLKDAIIRAYGEEFYNALDTAAKVINQANR